MGQPDARRSAHRRIHGDFQTPLALARSVVARCAALGARPATVLEPTCGTGGFLVAAREAFPEARLMGLELRAEALAEARARLPEEVELRQADLFDVDWRATLRALPSPALILGNPPWVTAAALGHHGRRNLPAARAGHGLRGLDARTGRSNFDISEWLLRQLIAAAPPGARIAMLLKESVARRLLSWAWSEELALSEVRLERIPAREAFGAAVEAALLHLRLGSAQDRVCPIYPALGAEDPCERLGYADGQLLADAAAHARSADVAGVCAPRWRSGVKHDAAAVFELAPDAEGRLRNGLGERVEVEPELLFPYLKGRDLRRGELAPTRRLLLPQRRPGAPTALLAESAPRAWAYLERHAERLAARRSRIYEGQPPFSVFGVGSYSFTPARVAVSTFGRGARFAVVPAHEGRPVLFDDTVALLPCESEAQARLAARLLDSAPARDRLAATVFWSAKRPLTLARLNAIDLARVAARLGLEAEWRALSGGE